MEISRLPSQPAKNLTFHIPDSHETAPVTSRFKETVSSLAMFMIFVIIVCREKDATGFF